MQTHCISDRKGSAQWPNAEATGNNAENTSQVLRKGIQNDLSVRKGGHFECRLSNSMSPFQPVYWQDFNPRKQLPAYLSNTLKWHSKHRPSGPWRWGTCRRLRSAFAAPVQRPPPVQTSCSSRGSQSSLFGPRNPPCMTPPSALPPLHWVGGQQSASLSRRCSLDSPRPARKTLAVTVRENEKNENCKISNSVWLKANSLLRSWMTCWQYCPDASQSGPPKVRHSWSRPQRWVWFVLPLRLGSRLENQPENCKSSRPPATKSARLLNILRTNKNNTSLLSL